VSVFKPVQFFGKRASLVEVALETGRTHQIRVHARTPAIHSRATRNTATADSTRR
jgi:23S rRNA-/tRNA-specific pseudouridylate synthase